MKIAVEEEKIVTNLMITLVLESPKEIQALKNILAASYSSFCKYGPLIYNEEHELIKVLRGSLPSS